MKFRIGEKIKDVFESKDIKLKDFAEQIDVARQNVYRIFDKDSIDTALLLKVSKVLEHDFFQYYTKNGGGMDERAEKELSHQNTTLHAENHQLKNELMLANKEIDYLKKIIDLMEERTKLLFSQK